MTDPKEIQAIGSIAHDIRQMLMVIVGRTGLLLAKDPDPELQRHLLAVEMAAADAAAMLGRLPGVGSGSRVAEVAPVQVVADESCRLILPPDGRPWADSTEAPGPGVWTLDNRIAGDLIADLPAQILREVFNNLLTNALAVMPDGGRVTLSGSSGQGRVHLRVQDSGPGVPADVQAKIFDPGFSTSGQPGRGLGLCGCRVLVEDFGGLLMLEPGPGPGAVFLLDLPAGEPELVPCGLPAGQEDGRLPTPAEILIVDDEAPVREMLADVLVELGWRPTVTVDADHALDAVTPGRFSVALVDQSLPGMSGLELGTHLRVIDPRMILVLVSGWGNEEIVAKAPASGFDFAEEKPLTVGKIRTILGRADALRLERGGEGDES